LGGELVEEGVTVDVEICLAFGGDYVVAGGEAVL